MNEKPKNEITDKVEDTTDPSPEAVTTKKAEVRSKPPRRTRRAAEILGAFRTAAADFPQRASRAISKRTLTRR